MANIAAQSISKKAITLTFANATATTGDAIDNVNGNTIVLVNNTSGSSTTVTADAKTTCDEGFEHDLSEAVAAGEIKPIPLNKWITDGTTGYATLICTPATEVKLAAISQV